MDDGRFNSGETVKSKRRKKDQRVEILPRELRTKCENAILERSYIQVKQIT
jgi:hypothetical protein